MDVIVAYCVRDCRKFRRVPSVVTTVRTWKAASLGDPQNLTANLSIKPCSCCVLVHIAATLCSKR